MELRSADGFAREEVQSLPPPVYKYSSQMLRELEELHKRIADDDEGVPAVIRMHSNESPLSPPVEVVSSITDYAQRSLHTYPDATTTDLINAIVTRILPTDISYQDEFFKPDWSNRVVVTNGSEQAIRILGDYFLDERRHCVLPECTFPIYNLALTLSRSSGVGQVALKEDGSCDTAGMLQIAKNMLASPEAESSAPLRGETKSSPIPSWVMVIVSTINNPTGGMISTEELELLVSGLPSGCMLVLDEAYLEFCRMDGGPDGVEVLERMNKLGRIPQGVAWVCLRSFSKAWALASLRCGYVVCSSPDVAECFRKVRGVFYVNGMAQAGVLAAIESNYVDEYVTQTIALRTCLETELQSRGYSILPSHANFVSLCLDDIIHTGLNIGDELQNKFGVLTTPYSLKKAQGKVSHYLRISTAPEKQQRIFLKCLDMLIAQAAK